MEFKIIWTVCCVGTLLALAACAGQDEKKSDQAIQKCSEQINADYTSVMVKDYIISRQSESSKDNGYIILLRQEFAQKCIEIMERHTPDQYPCVAEALSESVAIGENVIPSYCEANESRRNELLALPTETQDELNSK
ncbi:hypothetical protein D3C72_1001950 [compost metagenome]